MAMLTTEDFKLLKTQFKDALESVRKVRDMTIRKKLSSSL